MIATLKELGLAARDAAAVADAAARVTAYVQGGQVEEPVAQAAGYYAGSALRPAYETSDGPVTGRARGSAAESVGLRDTVTGKQLRHLLAGRHAHSGRSLLSATGSAGRAGVRPGPIVPAGELPEMLSLAEAARIAGVSRRYLSRLAAASEASDVAAGHDGQPVRYRLSAVRDPDTDQWWVSRDELARFMGERQPPTVVMGYDLTCSAPKSVSLLWAFGDPGLRADVEAALDAGVDAALTYLERHAAVGTVGGRNRPGLGLAVASYRHDLSRAEEPHLHVHNVIVNAVAVPILDGDGTPVRDEDGRARVEWRALDSEVLHAHVKTAGYLGAAALRHELSKRRGLEWRPVRNGVAELAGFPRGLLDSLSTRHREVIDEYERLLASGRPDGPATLAAAQRGSRAPKRVFADAEVRGALRRQLAAVGYTPTEVRALGAAQIRHIAAPAEHEIAALFDRLTGPHGITARRPTFTQRDVHQHIAAWAGDRLGAEAISALADRFLADPRVVHVAVTGRRRRNQPTLTFTTLELLEAEDNLLALYRQGRTDRSGLTHAAIPADLVQNAIAAVSAGLRRHAHGSTGLSDEQTQLVHDLLTHGDLIRPVIGPAGTGKTEAMRAVVHAYTAAGHAVLGAAHGGRQTEDLAERLGVRAEVVASWLTRLDATPDPSEVWPDGTVLIVDEATQVATRDAEKLLRYATRTGTVVILVGDPAQLGSVGAGGWYRHLVTVVPDVLGLAANQRQRGAELQQVRHALAELRSQLPDDARAALHRLAADGRVHVHTSRAALVAAVVEDWYRERSRTPRPADGGRTTLRDASRMMAERHQDAELLNQAARLRLLRDGTLTGSALRAAGREFQVGDEVITLTQAGHTLVPAGRARSEFVRTGTAGIVTGVRIDAERPERQAVVVRFPGKGDVDIGWDYLTYSFPDGRDGGLAHAYALTAHKAEGSTMPTARAVVADDTSRAGLYVMLSRARTDLAAHVVARRELAAEQDGEDWLPVLQDTTGPLPRLLDRLERSRPERLANDHDPVAHAAHRLRLRHSLAELAALRREVTAGTRPDLDLLAVRRAEIAAEAALAATTAAAEAPPELLERIGPQPHAGADRVTWQRAVAALRIYHERHQPAVPAHDLGPPPARDPGAAEQRWHDQRRLAEQLAKVWASSLDPGAEHRFHGRREALPRRRAVSGIHALLDRGWDLADLGAELTRRDTGDVRSGAAVLSHRVEDLLSRHGIDVTAYELPPSPSPHDEWAHAARLLDAAAALHRHPATLPPPDLDFGAGL